jgi:formylglycine-generating enzyme required for sulfatase activity
MHFAEPSAAWDICRHSPDPTSRSYLIDGMAPRGVDLAILIRRYGDERDPSARRAIVLSMGEYKLDKLTNADRDRLVSRLLADYRDDPDAGLHGAIDWLLRRQWGHALDVERIVQSLRGKPAAGRDWFVNSQGQTMTIVRGPAEFAFGSPPDEPGRGEGELEPQRRMQIGYSFAIATREVTVAEYRRFKPDYARDWPKGPADDEPVGGVSWYESAAYCRWLSDQEEVPEKQMCYLGRVQDIKPGIRLPDDFASRTGYRLPTAMEWECACRAGTVTARPYGRGTELLDRYGWYLKNGRDRRWPCGLLKPNDLGVFDMLGNTIERCQEASVANGDPLYDEKVTVVTDGQIRRLRGGSFNHTAPYLRSTYRGALSPYLKFGDLGFRPVRTLR